MNVLRWLTLVGALIFGAEVALAAQELPLKLDANGDPIFDGEISPIDSPIHLRYARSPPLQTWGYTAKRSPPRLPRFIESGNPDQDPDSQRIEWITNDAARRVAIWVSR